MNVSAELYSAYNDLQVETAQTLINKIKSKESQKKFDLILDIASGSGNVTIKFAESFDYKQLIGVDIDSKMIEYAKKNNAKEGVDYLQCDMEMLWNLLSNEIRQLKGRSSLVFSCTGLHWMTNVDTAVSNISQLMAPGAGLYVLMNPLNEIMKLDDGDKQHQDEFYSLLPMFEGQKFRNSWEAAFNKFGLRVDDWQTIEREFTFTIQVIEALWQPLGVSLYKKYLPNDVDMDEFFKKFPELKNSTRRSQKTGRLNPNGQELWSMKVNQWVIVATKIG